MAVLTIRDALNQALREELIRDENVFIMADAHPPTTWEPELIAYLSEPPEVGDGRTKVFWGTDHPVQKFAPSLAELDGLALDADTMNKLLCENARRILSLETPAS